MKKGFTLVELLAAIALISVLALIAVPAVNSMIVDAKRNGFVQNVNGLMRVISLDRENSGIIGIDEVTEYTISSSQNAVLYNGEPLNLKFTGKINGDGIVYVDSDGNMAVKYSNNRWCVYKNYMETSLSIKDGNCEVIENFDLTAPTLTVNSIVQTTNSVNLSFSANDPDTTYTTRCEYGTTKSYGTAGTISGNVCVLNNLLSNTTYYYRIITKNAVNLTTEVTGDTSPAAFSTISISASPSDYAHSKTVTITGTTTGATLQYQIGSTTGTWLEYTTPIEITNNTTVYARFYDGLNESQPASLTISTIINDASQVYYSNPSYTNGSITIQQALEELYAAFDY